MRSSFFLLLLFVSFSNIYGKEADFLILTQLQKEAEQIKSIPNYSLNELISLKELKSREGLDGDIIRIPFTVKNTLDVSCDFISVKGGIPISKGVIFKDYAVFVYDKNNNEIPAQINETAYWPDGSLKWVLVIFNTKVSEQSENIYYLEFQKQMNMIIHKRIQVENKENEIIVNTGEIEFSISKRKNKIFNFINSLQSSSKVPVLNSEDKSELFTRINHKSGQYKGIESFSSKNDIKKTVTLEEHGAERVVVRIEGVHYSENDNSFAPYTLRIYANAESGMLRFVHSFVYTGNPQNDFIQSIGFRLKTSINNVNSFALSSDQGTGHIINNNKDTNIPYWNHAVLSQNSSSSFTIKKWVDKENNSAVRMVNGGRSEGWGNLVSSDLNITMGIKNFWQEYPKAISIDIESQELLYYLYSPWGEELDLRRYSDFTYPELYETSVIKTGRSPVQPLKPWDVCATNDDIGAKYIGKTSEFFIDFSSTDTGDYSKKLSLFYQNPPIVSSSSEWIAKSRVMGDIAPQTADFEEKWGAPFEESVDFLMKEQDYRNWYSFLDYGDVIHSFDPTRDIWRRDQGGYAWNNNEHCINEGLWTVYLQSGDPELFRIAEAMTRHIGDVDMYHMGVLAGNGSRHNINHFGCLCKKRRMTLPENKRIYYYLTGDEHTRDLIHFIYQSFFENKDEIQYFTDDRNTMDLGVYASATLFMWETTGKEKYAKQLLNTTESMCSYQILERGFPRFLKFDPVTGKGTTAVNAEELQPTFFLLKFGPMDMLLNTVELTQSQIVHNAILNWAELLHLPVENAQKYQGRFESVIGCGRVASYAYSYTKDPRYFEYIQKWIAEPEIWFQLIGGKSVLDNVLHYIPRVGPPGSDYSTAIEEKYQMRSIADFFRNGPYCYKVLNENQ